MDPFKILNVTPGANKALILSQLRAKGAPVKPGGRCANEDEVRKKSRQYNEMRKSHEVLLHGLHHRMFALNELLGGSIENIWERIDDHDGIKIGYYINGDWKKLTHKPTDKDYHYFDKDTPCDEDDKLWGSRTGRDNSWGIIKGSEIQHYKFTRYGPTPFPKYTGNNSNSQKKKKVEEQQNQQQGKEEPKKDENSQAKGNSTTRQISNDSGRSAHSSSSSSSYHRGGAKQKTGQTCPDPLVATNRDQLKEQQSKEEPKKDENSQAKGNSTPKKISKDSGRSAHSSSSSSSYHRRGAKQKTGQTCPDPLAATNRDQLKEKYKKLEKSYEEKQTEVVSLKARLVEAEKTEADRDMEITHLNHKLTSAQKENLNFKRERENQKSRETLLPNLLTKKNEELKKTKDELKDLTRKMEDDKTKYEHDLKAQLDNFLIQLGELRKEKNELDKEVNKLKKQVKTLLQHEIEIKRLEETNKQLAAEVVKKRGEIASVGSDLESARGENSRLASKLESLSTENKEQAKTLSQHEIDIKRLELQIVENQKSESLLQERIRELEVTNEQLAAELDKKKGEITSVKSDLESASSESSRLASELESLLTENKEQAKTLLQHEIEIKTLEEQIREIQKSESLLQERIRELEVTNEQLAATIELKCNENENLMSDMKTSKANEVALIAQLSELTERQKLQTVQPSKATVEQQTKLLSLPIIKTLSDTLKFSAMDKLLEETKSKLEDALAKITQLECRQKSTPENHDNEGSCSYDYNDSEPIIQEIEDEEIKNELIAPPLFEDENRQKKTYSSSATRGWGELSPENDYNSDEPPVLEEKEQKERRKSARVRAPPRKRSRSPTEVILHTRTRAVQHTAKRIRILDRNFECTKCDKRYGRNERLQMHMKTVHENYRIVCAHCHAVFRHMNNLADHHKRTKQAACSMRNRRQGMTYFENGDFRVLIVVSRNKKTRKTL